MKKIIIATVLIGSAYHPAHGMFRLLRTGKNTQLKQPQLKNKRHFTMWSDAKDAKPEHIGKFNSLSSKTYELDLKILAICVDMDHVKKEIGQQENDAVADQLAEQLITLNTKANDLSKRIKELNAQKAKLFDPNQRILSLSEDRKRFKTQLIEALRRQYTLGQKWSVSLEKEQKWEQLSPLFSHLKTKRLIDQLRLDSQTRHASQLTYNLTHISNDIDFHFSRREE